MVGKCRDKCFLNVVLFHSWWHLIKSTISGWLEVIVLVKLNRERKSWSSSRTRFLIRGKLGIGCKFLDTLGFWDFGVFSIPCLQESKQGLLHLGMMSKNGACIQMGKSSPWVCSDQHSGLGHATLKVHPILQEQELISLLSIHTTLITTGKRTSCNLQWGKEWLAGPFFFYPNPPGKERTPVSQWHYHVRSDFAASAVLYT